MWELGKAVFSCFSPHKVLLPWGFSGHSEDKRVYKVLASNVYGKSREAQQDTALEYPWAACARQGPYLQSFSFFLIIWAQLRALIEFRGGGCCCICVLFWVWFLNSLSWLSCSGVFHFTLLMWPTSFRLPTPSQIPSEQGWSGRLTLRGLCFCALVFSLMKSYSSLSSRRQSLLWLSALSSLPGKARYSCKAWLSCEVAPLHRSWERLVHGMC